MISDPLISLAALAPAGLTVEPNAAAVAERVADALLQALRRGSCLGLATGRTMVPVYGALRRRLADLPSPERVALLEGWRSFNLDEYVGLGPADAGSFARFMADQLGDPLGLPAAALRLPDGLAANPEAEAQRYGAAVGAAGGIDLQLLGLGNNGHVGFNEPPCPADAPCRSLALSEATRLQNAAAFGGDPAAVPAQAITLGTAEIRASRRLLLVVTGGAKVEVLRRCLLEPPCAERPASWLQGHPGLQIVVDAAAAAALPLN